jgi:hypothetical protein
MAAIKKFTNEEARALMDDLSKVRNVVMVGAM